jgi:hypothetical protein
MNQKNLKRKQRKMSEKDFGVSVTGIPQVGQVSKKPRYLVLLEDNSGKTKSLKSFISVDKPDLLDGFIAVKGFFSDLSEDVISKTFVDIVESTPKESILDMMFPWHKIHSIRSLVFNANKPSTLVK